MRLQPQWQSQNSSTPTLASSGQQHQPDTGLDYGSSLAELADIHNFDTQHTRETTSNTRTADLRGHDSLAGDLKDLLSGADDSSLFEDYRSMSASFPFVPIPPGLDVDELLKRKPILLLAIMSAASWKDRKLQGALEERYRHEIANRTLVEPRKSVALIQSMLIYLSW